jgi:predicted site-specific integrase-resolvase
MMSEKYYTYEDLAGRWKVAVNTLRQYVMAGTLKPSIRIGRLVRFSESYILEIESNGGIRNVS